MSETYNPFYYEDLVSMIVVGFVFLFPFILLLYWTVLLTYRNFRAHRAIREFRKSRPIQNTETLITLNRLSPDFEKSQNRFYIFRMGEALPGHLKIVEAPNIVIGSENRFISEAKRQLRIDLLNHGFNGVAYAVVSTYISGNGLYLSTIVGRPVLVVSKNYNGNVDALRSRCSINFFNLIYSRARVCKNFGYIFRARTSWAFWNFGRRFS